MSELSLLRQILKANQSFLAGTPQFLDPSGDPLVVVTCIDPRLTGLIEPALGLPRHRAAIVRTAGNQISDRTPDMLRSIAAALYVKGASEVIVAGHTDCGMAGFSVSEVTERFRKAGIPRGAFGNEDLRTWFGAFASIRNNVVLGVEYLRRSGLVSAEIRIHGLIVDTERGAVEVVVDGDLVSQGAAPPALEMEPEPEPASAAKEDRKAEHPETRPPSGSPIPPGTAKTAKGPIVVGTPASAGKGEPAPAPPDSLLEAALVIRDFIVRERRDQKLQKAITDLRTIWNQQKNPVRIFSELERIAQVYERDYPSLRGALLYLQDSVRSGRADKIGMAEVMRRVLN